MKTRIFFILIVAIIFAACIQNSDKTNKAQVKSELIQDSNLKLQIYYFHTTRRCPTCNSIEDNIKQVLESDFKNEIERGIINFKSLNVEDAENKGLAEKYQATGAALHLIDMQEGVERNNDLTNYAFSHSRRQPEVFIQGMRDTINFFIK
jgi:thioredoxin-related protein